MREKHWMTWTRFNNIFRWIKARCNIKSHPSYKNYWWAWIRCLWNSFEEFKNDMYDSYIKHVEKFWEKNTTIDRIDYNWNYCKNSQKKKQRPVLISRLVFFIFNCYKNLIMLKYK